MTNPPAITNKTYKTVPVGTLTEHPRNPRQGDVGSIHGSLAANGFFGTIVVQESTGHVLVGNHRLRAAVQAGMPEVPVAFVDVDDETALRIMLADNRTAELATNDEAILGELLRELHASGGLDGTGYDSDDLDELLADLGRDAGATKGDGDAALTAADEAQAKWQVAVGDVWTAGPHRIGCGDSSDAALLARVTIDMPIDVVLTDPPYGIALDTDYTKLGLGKPGSKLHGQAPKKYRAVAHDDRPFDPTPYVAAFADVAEQFWFGANYYRRLLSDADLDGSWLVWDKRNEAADAMFGSGFELIWSRTPHKQDLLRHYSAGAFGAEAANRVHPTQKPTPLLIAILERWSKPGMVVVDPFLGSGSTIVAAERCGRVGVGVELDEAYVAVLLDRLVAEGLVPERESQW